MNTLFNTLKEVILDSQEMTPKPSIPRQMKIQTVSGKATVCIGVRRSGKSTFLFQCMQKLRKNIPDENIFYLNFFDDRLRALQQENLDLIIEAYFSLYPEKKSVETIYCFFDEIQVASGWEAFIDRLLRNENCEIYISGSSAQMLSTEIATQMRGRALSWEMFPFSFEEFLDYKGIKLTQKSTAGTSALSSKKRLHIQKACEEYWQSGSFPEVLGLDARLRRKIHQEYWGAMLFRDLIERHDIAHPKAVIDLAHYLVDNTASLYSINKLTNYLKSLGHKMPKSSVSDCLEWFEDAYILFTVRIFDASLKRANANPKKIYCIDHALVLSISSGILINSGHLLENLVFITLRRITADIFYYKTKSGREVDFIIKRQGRIEMMVQVCETLIEPKTRKREVTALQQAMAEQELSHGLIITRNEEELLQQNEREIRIVPLWRFLLEMEEIKNQV